MPDIMQALIRLRLAPCSLAAVNRSIWIPWLLFTTLHQWFTCVHLLYQHPNLSLFQPVEYTKLYPVRSAPKPWKPSTAGRFDKYAWNIFAGRPISYDLDCFVPFCETSDFYPDNRDSARIRTWQLIKWLPSYLKLICSFKEHWFLVPLSKTGHTTAHNTVNKGKLFVMVFAFASATMTDW